MATSKRVLSRAQLAALAKGRGSGAGGRPRKAEKKKPLTASVEPALFGRVATYAAAHKISRSSAVAALLDAALPDDRNSEGA